MYTEELIELLLKNKSSRKVFCGVIPLDQIPLGNRINKECSFIVNTHESNQPGEHWFAIYVPKRGPIEYFDSYGIPPYHEIIYKFFNVNKRNFIHNKIKLQHNSSKNCGKFTLFYIYYRSKGYTMKEYLKLFNTKYLLYNDYILNNLFTRINSIVSKSK